MSAEGVISRDTAAKLLMLTPRHLSRLVSDGWIKKTDSDKFTVVGCVQGYISYLKDETRRNSQKSSQSKAAGARAREIELRIAQREGELIEADAACAAMMTLAGTVRSSLDGLPARFTRDLRERDRLRKEIDDILEGVARALDVAGQAVRTGGGGDTPVAEDDA